ncbi:MAG: hypothetical protein RLY31_511 [Bacteroidota bacterium]|jgi:peroxiredoxin
MSIKYFNIGILAITALLFHACGGDAGSKGLTVSGTINQGSNIQLFLDRLGLGPNGANLVIGKADLGAGGTFELALPERPEAGLYRLRVGEQSITLVLDGSEQNITIQGDLGTLNQMNYQVTGSAGTTTYRDVIRRLMARSMNVDDLKVFVDTTSNPYTAIYTCIQAIGNNASLMDIYKKAEARLAETYPNSGYLADYRALMANVQRSATNPGRSNGFQFIDAGNRQTAPDIKLPDPSGKEYALSELKGKVVLLDFWASWCRPCRMENPNVVKIYNRYKDRGFTVFSVSLDGVDSRQRNALQNDAGKINEALQMQRKRWKEAIQADGLVWDYHVSDLKKWECEPAGLYGVSSIPRTFMIDREGNIAAVNLRGAEQIEETLLKLL